MFKFRYWIFIFIMQSSYGVTIVTVTLSSDNDPGGIGEGAGDTGDLRFCLNTMNQNLNAASDDYLIIFGFDVPTTIQLNGILPIINNSLNAVNITIGNSNPDSVVTIDGNGIYSGFFIPMGNVIIQNMIFKNITAKGGDGGSGNAGGGGGMGAGAAIYAPQTFLNGSSPVITLINVSTTNCSVIGGQGGSSLGGDSIGSEGGGGGGGFSGKGGSITTTGSTGGAGGGGFGGDGGNATISTDDPNGGGGGGGGGLGSRATQVGSTNLGDGGSDIGTGVELDGNGYGLTGNAGSGGGGYLGGSNAGGGAGGVDPEGGQAGGGGGGSANGSNGSLASGSFAPGGGSVSSGGNGADGGGGGGAAVVATAGTNYVDGQGGGGGYAGGGGGGSGIGGYDTGYTVQGGKGGLGGGGGGGGSATAVDASGGSSTGGGGGGGGGSVSGTGGSDIGNLGGGAGGNGGTTFGGGGGGGSALGAAVFVDSGLNFTIQALSGTQTTFNTSNNTLQAGAGGSGGLGAFDGFSGTALVGNSIFLRANSSLYFSVPGADDVLVLGDQVSFTDDTNFGGGGTAVVVRGNGTVVYNGTTDYQGSIYVYNANFKVNELIEEALIWVCRDQTISQQRGTLSGVGTLTGTVFVNSGIISPDTGQTLTLGPLTLSSADPIGGTAGSLMHSEIDAAGTSLVSVTGPAALAGILEIDLDPNAVPGSYTLLTSTGITGTFDSVTFTGAAPQYTLSYLPVGNPTYVQFDLLATPPPTVQPPSYFKGTQKKNNFGLEYELYNQLEWTLSLSPAVSEYLMYRDGQEIASVGASTFSYSDHNREKGVVYTYSITAADSAGNESVPVTVAVAP